MSESALFKGYGSVIFIYTKYRTVVFIVVLTLLI